MASTLLPQAPLTDVRRVATRILDDSEPVAAPLRGHGPAAKRRRITRSLLPWYVVVAALVLVRIDRGPDFDVWLWSLAPASLVLCLALGVDRIRMLGHRVREGQLITSSGSWGAKRVVLESEGIIGWSTRTSPFQRWAGLTTLSATTPAGQGNYIVLDLPAKDAWGTAETLTPGVTDVWGSVADADGTTRSGRPR